MKSVNSINRQVAIAFSIDMLKLEQLRRYTRVAWGSDSTLSEIASRDSRAASGVEPGDLLRRVQSHDCVRGVHRTTARVRPQASERTNVAGKDISEVSQEGTIVTGSRLRMWFLTRFRGYRIRQRRQVPEAKAFGRIGYRRQWLLGREK